MSLGIIWSVSIADSVLYIGGLQVNVPPLPQPFILYWALGGIFGTIASFSMVVLKRVRANKGILLGVLTLGVSQLVNLVFETFFHFAYLSSPITNHVNGFHQRFFLAWLLGVFYKKSQNQILTQSPSIIILNFLPISFL